MNLPRIERKANPNDVAWTAGKRYLESALEAVHERGRFVVVLSGGSTPRRLYRMLTAGPLRPRLPWSRTIVLFGDERCVPPDHERSNYRMARETLLDNVRLSSDQVHRMQGELDDPAVAAERYEMLLREIYAVEGRPRFDLLLLGVGDDGHTASLFPGSPALDETERWVAPNHAPHLPDRRLTLTLPALCSARRVLFLVTGADKAPIVAEAFGGQAHEGVYPCERVQPTDGDLEIIADTAATALLP